MIGRSEELARLHEALAHLPQAVIISGEAGIGKTRLINEFLMGTQKTARIARGGCIPLADGLEPLAPIAEMLRAVGVQDFPQEADQSRLFASLRETLDSLDGAGPLVVVLEDLHWADPSTRALLAHLVHGMRSGRSRMLLIGTCRNDELPQRHPLRALLAELDRAGTARIELGRLGPEETTAQIRGILNGPVEPLVAQRLHERCGGNPFLVEELLAAGDVPLPLATRDILLKRVRQMSPHARHLLLAVAVAGGRADSQLLAKVVPDRLELLREAMDEHVLVVVPGGYAFRHALVAEALVAEALPDELTRLHRACAEALAQLPHSAAEIAHHWFLAGDPDRALLACVEAGLAAERLFAQSEARQHFDRAIELWSPSSPVDLAQLCRHAAEAAYLDGDTPHAISLIRKALRESDQGTGALYERLGRYLWANGDAEAESIGAYERAVSLAAQGPSAERAGALTGLASALTYADRPGALDACEEALHAARAAGARGEEGRALQSLGYCAAMAGNVESGLSHCRHALAIAAELDRSEDQYRAYANLVGVLRMAGRTAEAAATAMEGVDLARKRGAERTYGNLLLGDAIEAMILLGRWDEADALLPADPDVLAHGTPVIATNLWLSAANLHTWRGKFGQSRVFLDACQVAYAMRGHGHVRSMLHANLSELCLWQGRFAEAGRWIRTELDLLGPTDFTSLLSRLILQGLRAEAGLARPADLPRLVELLEEISHRPDPPPDATALIALSWAELARVRGEPDPELWSAAADHWVKLDMPWPLAYTRWRLAETLLAGRPDAARREAGAAALFDAHTIALRLGAEPLRREVFALARRTRLQSVAAPAPSAPPSPLTARERDVLELICAGATNRRIAQQLFISEKTVSIHVSNILAKLGAANRSEAAAIARSRAIAS